MSLVERVHTATADCVPQFDVAIQAARSIQTRGGRIFHTGDARCVLLRWNGTGKTLTGVDIIYAQYLVIGANHHVVTSRMERQTTNGNTILKKHILMQNWHDMHIRSSQLTVITLWAFFTDALDISNSLTEQSRDADARICSLGWNSKYDTSSVWSYSVRMTGWPCCSPRAGSASSGADLASIRSTSRILMLASTLPVATNWPSKLNAPARHACLCDVTYAVS